MSVLNSPIPHVPHPNSHKMSSPLRESVPESENSSKSPKNLPESGQQQQNPPDESANELSKSRFFRGYILNTVIR
jgi:hypothetical protein